MWKKMIKIIRTKKRKLEKQVSKKLVLTASCLMAALYVGGCAAAENPVLTEPPAIELSKAGDDSSVITITPCGYNWTYLESEETAVSSIADSAAPLSSGAPWETLTISDNASYNVSLPCVPDAVCVTAWDIADIGKLSTECQTVEDDIWSAEEIAEIAEGNFTILLQADRVYSLYLGWDKDKGAENGFFGDVYYTFKTGEEPSGKTDESSPPLSALTGKDSDILLSLDESYQMTAESVQNAWKIESGPASSASGFADVLIKYSNLDIVEDENQYTDDDVIYCLQIFDRNGQMVQTLEYQGNYLCIDKVRYRENGVGTTRELFLAIDNLFAEKLPEASFGAADAEEVDVVEGVTMEASYVTSKGVHLVFTNDTDKDYLFGDDYELWTWQDGEWRKVEYIIDNAAFNSIGYLLAGFSTAGWDVKWTYFHGVLPDGQYRITKTISENVAGQGDEHYRLAAEFMVSGSGE